VEMFLVEKFNKSTKFRRRKKRWKYASDCESGRLH